jgi:hypothetical protein
LSKFSSHYRVLMNSDASHAWVHLHRCVETYSRTTRETFNSIFNRIEKEFNIDRSIRHKWPTLSQMHVIAAKLKKEREDYLIRMMKLIKERREEKKAGKRNSTNTKFIELTHKQTNHESSKKKFWYWRDERNDSVKIRST